jgi:hypothetical protein
MREIRIYGLGREMRRTPYIEVERAACPALIDH